jgi:multiple sugar transport system substrate-binding protein
VAAPDQPLISRRRLLGGMAGLAGLGISSGVLAACRSNGTSARGSVPSASAPVTGSTPASAAGSTTLGSFYSDPLPRMALEEIVLAFTAKTGIAVDLNTQATADFQNQISAYLQGTPDDAFTWFAGNRMRFFAAQGLATAITDIWPTVQANISEGVRVASTGTDGKPYLVPFHTYPWVIIHRRSVWEQRGYEQPASLGELLDLARRMRRDGLVPFAFGDKDGWPAMGTFDILDLRLNGYDFHLGLAEGREQWTDRRVRDVFETWRQLLPFHQRGGLGRTWQEAAQTMLKGGAGMYFSGTFAGEQTDAAGRADLELIPFPTLGTAFDAERAIDAPVNGFMLSRAPKAPDAANAFLAYVASGDAQVAYVTQNPNRIAVALDADTSGYTPFQQQMAAALTGAGRLAQFLDRDSRPDFTGPTGMQRFLQDFLTDPAQDLDAFLGRIQAFWDTLA